MAVYSLLFRPNKYKIRLALHIEDANLLSCSFLIDPILTQPYYIPQFNLLELLSFSFMSLV